MNRGPYIFLGAFAILALSWTGAILANQMGHGSVTPYFDSLQGQSFPAKQPGIVARGEAVYNDLGCAVCHTQQVRREDVGADLARGWGERAGVVRDYIQDNLVQLGSNRIGSDLRNVGARFEDADAFYEILYSPETRAAGMPAYRFLFEESKIAGEVSEHALDVDAPEGYQVVPTERARSLVAYLAYRQDSYVYPEVNFVPPEPESEDSDEDAAEGGH
ncbi:MAG: cbb3-type cytochrome c oxidase subunit II [Synoicihabitans sp.]